MKKQHFALHERNPGHEIAARISDIPGTGWSVAKNDEYYGVPGFGIDMIDGCPCRLYTLPKGVNLTEVTVGNQTLLLGAPLPEVIRDVVATIPTEVDDFFDWSYQD